MEKELRALKKKYGEGFSKFCRSHFSPILETEGVLTSILEDHFQMGHYLYDDIIAQNQSDMFIAYIKYLAQELEQEKEKGDRWISPTPQEILQKKGYKIYHCLSVPDVEQFEKYYTKGERLCTFNRIQDRLNGCHIFWLVREDADKIDRKDFVKPMRQDDYGASVLSVQFPKGGGKPDIISRYNHSVPAPNNSFSNDVNNIAEGLREAFEEHYNLSYDVNMIRFVLPGYFEASDKKFYKVNSSFNLSEGQYAACADNFLLVNGRPTYLDKRRFELFDYFVLDKEQKTLQLCVPRTIFSDDAFVDMEIKKTTVKNGKNGQRIIDITTKDDKKIEITLNRANQMIEYYDEATEIAGNNFLRDAKYLKKCTMPNLRSMGMYALQHALNLEVLDSPNLETMEQGNLQKTSLRELNAPKLRTIGSFSLESQCLENLECPLLEQIGDSCFFDSSFTHLDLPNLKTIGNDSFRMCDKLESLSLPCLRVVDSYVFEHVNKLKELYAPELRTVAEEAFKHCDSLEKLNVDSLRTLGVHAFESTPMLQELNVPNLRQMERENFNFAQNLHTVIAPNLEKIGSGCFVDSSLKKLQIPKDAEIGEGCFPLTHFSVLKDGELTSENRKKFIQFDYFVLDVDNKKIMPRPTYEGISDSIQNLEIESIEVEEENEKQYFSTGEVVDEYVYKINITPKNCSKDKPAITMKVKNNQLVEYTDSTTEKIPDNFLSSCVNLEKCCFEVATEMGDNCLGCVNELTLDKLEKMGDNCCRTQANGTTLPLRLPELKSMGSGCFESRKCYYLDFPKLEVMGSGCFKNNNGYLTNLELESLRVMGKECFERTSVEKFAAPNLEQMGVRCFKSASYLKHVHMPKLRVVPSECFYELNNLQTLSMPNVVEIMPKAFYSVRDLQRLDLPSVEYIAAECFHQAYDLIEFNAPLLEILGGGVVGYAEKLKTANIPSLREMGQYSFNHVGLEIFDAPALTRMERGCMDIVRNLRTFSVPKLEKLSYWNLQNAPNLEIFNAGSLRTAEGYYDPEEENFVFNRALLNAKQVRVSPELEQAIKEMREQKEQERKEKENKQQEENSQAEEKEMSSQSIEEDKELDAEHSQEAEKDETTLDQQTETKEKQQRKTQTSKTNDFELDL